MSIGLLTSTIQAAKRFRERADPVVQNFGSGLSSIISSDDDYSYLGKKKSLLELMRLSAVVCGIELCYAAETAFVSPILLKFGVPTAFMSLVWCLSPILGILAVPVLGSLSDNCKLKIGRRRPFIILLATGIVLGLLIVPNGKTLGLILGDHEYNGFQNTSILDSKRFNNGENSTLKNTWNASVNYFLDENSTMESHESVVHTKGIVITIIGVVLLDLSCDAAQSPSRAYLLDVSIPEDHSRGLGTFSVMAGLGGCIGYIIGGIDWDIKHTGGWSLEQHVTVVFSSVTVFFIICLVGTLTSFKEIPLCEKSTETLQKSTKSKGKTKYEKFTNEEEDDEDGSIPTSSSFNYGSTNESTMTEPKEKDSQCNKETNTQPMPSLDSLLNEVKLKTYFVSIIRMPRSLFVLCLTNLFSWMSLVCYSLYFTDFVGQAVYGGNPNAPRFSQSHQLYDDGVRLGSFGMSLYSLSCAIYAMFVEKLVDKFGKYHLSFTYFINLNTIIKDSHDTIM